MCFHYNKGNGDFGSCKYKTSCTNLHLCQHFLQEDCKFGAACKRSHKFDANALKILSARGLSAENMRRLLKLYKNRLLIASAAFKKKETGEWNKASNSICLLHTLFYTDQNNSSICSGIFFPPPLILLCFLSGQWLYLHWKDAPDTNPVTLSVKRTTTKSASFSYELDAASKVM